MDRVDRVLKHDLFLYNIGLNNTAESQRRFCRHNMEHFLDVARIAVIISLDEAIDVDREIIYAAALLHDIGKHVQYSDGIGHEIAGAKIAPKILKDCGFTDDETNMIADAILNHRNSEIMCERNLKGILYRADKASRACFACDAEKECNWKADKKNLTIKY